ncbi:MAG: hypothetical protein AB8H86_31495 [Polyangiales bacterium]
MAHRDDHQAALLRADALERELAEAKEALVEKERALSAREAVVAELEADAAERAGQREQDAAEGELARQAAKAELDDIRRRGAEAAAEAKNKDKRERLEAAERKDRDEQRTTQLRVIRSSSLTGGMFTPATVFFAIPLFGFSVVMLSSFPTAWSFGGGGVLVATLLFFAYVYPPIRAKQLPREIHALPYAVPGFLELLSRKAPRRDECTLLVTLEFAGSPPADLGALMKAADVTLEPIGRSRFRRSFPISVHRSKHGTRLSNHDTNLPLLRWFTNLERKVLRPIHALHPIASLTLTRGVAS